MVRLRAGQRLHLVLVTATVAWAVAFGAVAGAIARAQQQPTKSLDEVITLMSRAGADGRLGTAQKTRPVDARPAQPGEIVITMIKGEGKETQSNPASTGDWVVRNRCPDTGNEQYLVAANKFAGRYKAAGPAAADGWQAFMPEGRPLRFLVLTPAEAPFEFVAPWGEKMVARAGDAMVQDPDDERDVYRIAQWSFQCSYEVVTAPARP